MIRIQPLPQPEIAAMLRPIIRLHKLIRSAHLGGQANVESGHASALGKKYGPINGQNAFDNKTGIYSPDFDRTAHSSVLGKRSKENGKGLFSLSHEQRVQFGKLGGDGARIQKWLSAPENADVRKRINRQRGKGGAHVRWHRARGIVSDKCDFCMRENS